jgi:hypothetical protein
LASPQAQQLQLQHMLIQQQQQQMQPGGFTSPQALAASAPLTGVFYSPMAAGADLSVSQAAVLGPAASPTVLCPVNQQQKFEQQAKQYSAPSYISATAGMYPAHAPSSNGLISLTSAGPSPGNSAAKLQPLQPTAAEQAALQQAAAMQHAALLLQELQLSGAMGAGMSRLSSDSLQSSLLLGSSSTLLPLSQMSCVSDFSNDNLSAFMSNSYPVTQELGMRSNSGMLLGGVRVAPDTSLLPLESCGLIQMSAMDEPPVLDQNSQCQQQVTIAMQQAGRYW